MQVLPVELSRLNKVRDLEMTTDNVTFPPPAISRSGTRKVLEFLRRADRAWKSNVFDLSEMDLDILPLDIITLFPNITGLYVDNNAVSEIPFEFHVMTQLEELRFDQHLMRSPSMEIWELGIQKAMQFMRKFLGYHTDPRVDLRGWQLHAIPDEVFDIKLGPRVTLFDFSQNQLVALPAMIDTLTSLRELRLDENLMEKLPRCLCSLSSLHRLSVTRNRLRAFPNHMHHMHSLRFLYLDDNELEALPPSIIRAHNLEEISVCSNRISEFPEGLPQLPRLRNILVADNRIERLPIEFHHMTYISTLDITGNLMCVFVICCRRGRPLAVEVLEGERPLVLTAQGLGCLADGVLRLTSCSNRCRGGLSIFIACPSRSPLKKCPQAIASLVRRNQEGCAHTLTTIWRVNMSVGEAARMLCCEHQVASGITSACSLLMPT